MCGDGTPNGYGVFIGDGNNFSDWYYMGYHDGMDSRDYQLRLYRGDAITGMQKMDNKNGKEGYYSGFCSRGKRLSSTQEVYNRGSRVGINDGNLLRKPQVWGVRAEPT